MKDSVTVTKGDCLENLAQIRDESVDLVYLDPPFLTQRAHRSMSRDGRRHFGFEDVWKDESRYCEFIFERLLQCHRVLKDTGSIFFHCDKSASHLVRLTLDSVFGSAMFQSEIIWTYKRWSNSRRGLLPAHQTIFFYSKTKNFKFNQYFDEYSPSTNIEQIMQKRTRDSRNKSVYAIDQDTGDVVSNGVKKGVPVSDVWDIPFLNPKANERVGYPTQKPILLMKKIVNLVTDKGDTVLDPFCGSGSMVVAAMLLHRISIGIDISEKAIDLTRSRVAFPVETTSNLLDKGEAVYRLQAPEAEKHLSSLDYLPVRRNKGIDGLLKSGAADIPVFVRVQRKGEAIHETVSNLKKAARSKGRCSMIVVATELGSFLPHEMDGVHIVQSVSVAVNKLLETGFTSNFDQENPASNNNKADRMNFP